MNELAQTDENRRELPQHARIVVYDECERGLLTVYDCAATQKPPSARLIGHLTAIHADCEREETPTGARVTMREPAVLERAGEDRWIVETRTGSDRQPEG